MKQPIRVLLVRAYPPDLTAALTSQFEVIAPNDPRQNFSYDDVMRQAGTLSAVISQGDLRIDEALVAAAPQLRIAANESIGANNFVVDAMRRRAIWGTNAPDGFVEATADCTLGLLLMAARRMGEGERFVRAGRWRTFAPGTWDGVLLRGHTLGLVGFGRIGQAVARRAEPFGLTVIHHTRTRSSHPGWRSLDDLLAQSDFVSLHTPLNDDSRGLINERRIAQMKAGAYLLNLARGPVVDEAALITALQTKRLAGAALDVFANEPQVPAALTQMENVVLTPHIGGGSKEGRRSAQETCVENVTRVLTGKPPRPECVVVAPQG